MAVIWLKHVNGERYEVRSAGRTLRLYSNGVFHSQYHPQRPFLGGVWDLLYLPLFLHPGPLRRVLLLGLGAGAVIHPLMRFCQPDRLDAVEIQPEHIHVAQAFFGVNYPQVHIHQGDAVGWLQESQQQWDLIIEDLYGHGLGEPERGAPLDSPWIQNLSDHLTDDGLLVMNFTSRKALNETLPVFNRSNLAWRNRQGTVAAGVNVQPKEGSGRRLLKGAVFTTPGYNNQVLALSRQWQNLRSLRAKIPPELQPVEFNARSVASIMRG